MKSELLDLLTQAGVRTSPADMFWSDLVILHNRGGVPPPREDHTYSDLIRGFHVLVLGPRGRPTHRCKCRPAAEGPYRESLITQSLSRVPELARIVPPTTCVTGRTIHLQASVFLPGASLEPVCATAPAQTCVRVMQRLLETANNVARCAVRLPELGIATGTLELAAEARPRLQSLETVLPQEDVAALANALDGAEPLLAAPQHGDLWPANALNYAGSYWLLDFESYGVARVPLYDMFHVLRTVSDLRDGSSVPWLDRAANPTTFAAACGPFADQQATRAGVSRHQAARCLVYYVVHVAAETFRNGVFPAFWKAHVREAMVLARRLRDGVGIDELYASLFPGGRA